MPSAQPPLQRCFRTGRSKGPGLLPTMQSEPWVRIIVGRRVCTEGPVEESKPGFQRTLKHMLPNSYWVPTHVVGLPSSLQVCLVSHFTDGETADLRGLNSLSKESGLET